MTISSADHGFMKPHPSIFQVALGRAGASSEEAVMVGDSLAHDIEGARRLGIRAVLVSRSGPRRRIARRTFRSSTRFAICQDCSDASSVRSRRSRTAGKVAELEKIVWGYTDAEDVVPPPVLIVSIKRGGVLLGAFDDAGEMKGFVYSIPALKDGRPTQWSHMLGVTPDARDSGLGVRLKLEQRDAPSRWAST